MLAWTVDPDLVPWILGGAALVFGLGLVLISWWWLRRRRARALPVVERVPSINVSEMSPLDPLATGPQVTCYGVSIRLQVVVLAPAGRDATLPEHLSIEQWLDHLVPSLGRVCAQQRPRVDRWPPQLSAHGFMHALFAEAALPGHQGKGTPWLALAGRAQFEENAYLVGLVGSAAEPNNLGEISIEHPGQWLDVLRIRE